MGGWSTPRPGRFTPGKETRYPLHSTLDGSQDRSGRVWKISQFTGIESPDSAAGSNSLHLLSYFGRITY